MNIKQPCTSPSNGAHIQSTNFGSKASPNNSEDKREVSPTACPPNNGKEACAALRAYCLADVPETRPASTPEERQEWARMNPSSDPTPTECPYEDKLIGTPEGRPE